MGRAKGPSVDWALLDLEQLEEHLKALKEINKTPTAAFMAALRRKRREAKREGIIMNDVHAEAEKDWRDEELAAINAAIVASIHTSESGELVFACPFCGNILP